MKNLKSILLFFTVSSFFLIISPSCKKDDDPKPPDYTKINTWIDENMRFYYLWEDKIPTTVNKSLKPDAFFESLLYTPTDRFSWIQENYLELLNSLEGIYKEAGYDFTLYRESESNNNVIAQITYIKPNSPASSTALKRGDVFNKINGTQITTENYQTLLEKLSENHTINYYPMDAENESLGSPRILSLSVVEYSENPNFLSKVITQGDRKVGYYVYNFFAEGNGKSYDNQMDEVFNNFKNNNITDLVLDLRFNSGGAVTSAINLASLIAPSVTKDNIFIKTNYNTKVENEIINDPDYGPEYLVDKFLDKSQNIGSLLKDKKIYILTSNYTASASELIINGLRPYMSVYLIGATTYGKNVGSISIYEENDPNNKWGMQPMVVKTSNSLNFGDYGDGFAPDVENFDNDFYIYPLGDSRETLLKIALQKIAGTSSLVVKKSAKQHASLLFKPSLFNKKTTNMYFNHKRLKSRKL